IQEYAAGLSGGSGCWGSWWGRIVQSNATQPGIPDVYINNVNVTEGDNGTVDAVFTVSLSTPSLQTVTVNYTTSDGTAKAGFDYVSESGTLIFKPEDMAKPLPITVHIIGD